MPETDVDRGREVAARLTAALRDTSLGAKSTEPVEVSVGLAAWQLGQDWPTVYQIADMDLYEHKRLRKLSRQDIVTERQPLRLLPRGRAIRRRVAGS